MSDEPKPGHGVISEPTLAHHVLARVEALEARVDQLENRAAVPLVPDAPHPGEPGYPQPTTPSPFGTAQPHRHQWVRYAGMDERVCDTCGASGTAP